MRFFGLTFSTDERVAVFVSSVRLPHLNPAKAHSYDFAPVQTPREAMRLLQLSNTGDFSLTKDLVGDHTIPPYAILSHTWGADADEVTFEDMTQGTGENKLGYEKIRFCGEQARQDGLDYFWVDTCCIDKKNKAELARAINSMFRWYRNATRCYVYLSDVSIPPFNTSDEFNPRPWESDFRKSKWFTRGWTLQELLAPYSVEFFSRERKRLGDKVSLRQQVHEITNISQSALQGDPLPQFSVEERLRWIEHRETKLEEDKAYSLLGIFNVYILPIYDEGKVRAFTRLLEEFQKMQECIQGLRLTDPRYDKDRIEDAKGGLLESSYHWIIENSDFQQWRWAQQSRLLWIKGDPGKGKTMLLCGIIDELEKSIAKSNNLSYFFCQATDSRINNATAVLRGLLYLLVNQQPSLISHIRKEYDNSGKTLFEDTNAWVALSKIFTNALQDPHLNSTYLIVDALDECVVGLPKLLEFISRMSSVSPRVKWVVSSRNWPSIEKDLDTAVQKVRLCLELNEKSISSAVATYIQFKVDWLAKRNRYTTVTRDAVRRYLSLNANGTFLWVALVCQEMSNISGWKAQQKLTAFPPGLDGLYRRMIGQIRDSEDADLCKRILAVISVVYRPVTLDELASLVDMPDGVAGEYGALSEIIGLCGSFLTLRERIISFVHQSAKDFLLAKASNEIFPSGKEETHHKIFSRSLEALSRTLRRDIYSLGALGCPIKRVKRPDPDPLVALRYSSIYWVDHLCDWNANSCANHSVNLQGEGVVHEFVKEKYLYWLEALSLCKSMSEGLVSVMKLEALIQARADASALIELVRDARRFIMYHKQAIENSPLQAYVSALVFSPTRSLIRGLFKKEEPKWITIELGMGDKWSACLQMLEGYGSLVMSVAFSHDSTRLASASSDWTVNIWDANNGECLWTLKSHSGWVFSVAFSHDSTWLASGSGDRTVKIWDANRAECLQTLEGHSGWVMSVAFSHDSTWLASGSADKTVKIWDTNRGECLWTLRGHSDLVRSMAFSHGSAQLASASHDKTVKIWDVSSGRCLRTLKGHSGWVHSVAFSHDSTRLASASSDYTVKIWDVNSGEFLRTLEGHSDWVMSVAFPHDSTTRLASGSGDGTVKIWDESSGECLWTLEAHSGWVTSVAFSHDSTWLSSASNDKTVKIWDASSGECLQTLEGHSTSVNAVAFSHDSVRLASASYDNTVKIWDASSGHCSSVNAVAFSHDSARLASASDDRMVKIWDASSGECLQTLEGHSDGVLSVAFSHNSAQVASASDDGTVKIWDASSGACLQTLNTGKTLYSISFDITGSYLHTEIGTIKIRTLSGSRMLLTNLEPQSPQYQGLALSADGAWITHDSENLVWLPSEYRPSCSTVSRNTIGVGVGTGRVWICKLNLNVS